MPDTAWVIVNPNPDEKTANSPEYSEAKKGRSRFETSLANLFEIFAIQKRTGLHIYIREPKKVPEVEHKVGEFNIAGMSRKKLLETAMLLGVTIRNKNVGTEKLREMVQRKFDDALGDDDIEDIEDAAEAADEEPSEE